ncbi:hypothetical protein A2U01_0001001 [Trifolium medium]|uniref:Reverse transcriptase domain-containing protein n=1 Tax=Trifolium medium TaxID=97028 RepID=A0A392LZ54_9FABA|nr:hypothetical protein [Trifolium medium]
MEHLNLVDEEEEFEIPEEELQKEGGGFNPALCLVGRFLTNKPVRVDSMMENMAGVWTPVKGVAIKEVKQGRFIFQFFHHLDVQKVLRGGPWFFNKHMLILGAMGEGEEPEQVPLNTVPFWIQVHNLPAGYMSKTVGKNVGDYVGELIEYDEKNSSDFWKKYMRIRVMVDVRKPLVQTKRVKKKGVDVITVQLKYERLGIFCYYCGLLGHTEDGCNQLFSVGEDDGERAWGPSLRVDQRRRNPNGGGRWLRWEGQSSTWQTPNQEREGDINGAIMVENKINSNGAVKEEEKRKVMITELMRNPSLLKTKTLRYGKEADLKQNNMVINAASVDIDEEEHVESDKKRMRDGNNKEGEAVKNLMINAPCDMQLDGGEVVIRSWQPGLPGAMSFLSWNCRGLGNSSAVPTIRDLVRKYKVDVIFLCETLVHANKIEEIRVGLGFDAFFAVDRIGRSGGLAILWRQPFVCNLINYSTNFINMEVTHPTYPSWRLTGFYGYPENERRRDSWDLLRTLSQDNTLPWCIIGDFNDILSNEEKRSKVDHPPWRIRGFRDAIQDSNLVDIPLIGYPFTWIKGRGGDDMKEERLDRAMATQAWFDTFPNCQLHNLVASRSDHYPILLKIQEGNRRKIMRKFKFENSWLYEDELESIVHGGWGKDSDGGVMTKLKNCTNELNEWGRQLRNKYHAAIEDCRNELEGLRNASNHGGSTRYEEVQRKMSMLLAQEEAFWKQRAKIYWLRDGDTNSRFFHATASARKKRNEITHLKKDDGQVAQNQHEVCEVAKNYFEQLFSPGQQGHDTVLNYIIPSITEADNNQLTTPFQIKEFKEALFAMHSDKAPGPDGLNPAFYKRFWSLCGVEIFNAGITWLEEGTFPEQIMATNIVLIPKKDNPESMKDFRPISLCNVLYKIISKVLANRLKPLLPQCISQEQSAFVENRSIIDNVMIASEIIHHMKCKTKGKKGEVALKIDISKAYDRVDWEYVKKIMRKMGFHEKWVNWISMCMESVHYQVLVNGESVGPVKPLRGLRQGDPLSPYIFIMCAEGLSGLLKQSEARGEIHGQMNKNVQKSKRY